MEDWEARHQIKSLVPGWSSQKRSYRCAAHNLEYNPERPDPQACPGIFRKQHDAHDLR